MSIVLVIDFDEGSKANMEGQRSEAKYNLPSRYFMPEMQTCLFMLSGKATLLMPYKGTCGGWALVIIIKKQLKRRDKENVRILKGLISRLCLPALVDVLTFVKDKRLALDNKAKFRCIIPM